MEKATEWHNEWTAEHQLRAMSEGWDIVDSQGSCDGDIQIQAIDDLGILKYDTEAWKIVSSGTMPHHKKAKEILVKYNPQEHKRITTLY